MSNENENIRQLVELIRRLPHPNPDPTDSAAKRIAVVTDVLVQACVRAASSQDLLEELLRRNGGRVKSPIF